MHEYGYDRAAAPAFLSRSEDVARSQDSHVDAVCLAIGRAEQVRSCLAGGVGAVGAKLVFPNNTIQSGGVILGMNGWAGHA